MESIYSSKEIKIFRPGKQKKKNKKKEKKQKTKKQQHKTIYFLQ